MLWLCVLTKRKIFIGLSIRFYKTSKASNLTLKSFLILVLFNTVSFCSHSWVKHIWLLFSLQWETQVPELLTFLTFFDPAQCTEASCLASLPRLSVFSKCSFWEGSASSLSSLWVITSCCVNHKCAIWIPNSRGGFKPKAAMLYSEV